MKKLYDEKIEEGVCAVSLIDPKALNEVLHIIQPEAFYIAKHKAIITEIVDMRNKNQSVDMLTVGNRLTEKEPDLCDDWNLYLMELSMKVSSSAHLDVWIHIINEYYQKRQFKSVLMRFTEVSGDVRYDDMVSEFSVEISNINKSGANKTTVTTGEVLPKVLDMIEGRVEPGYPTIFTKEREMYMLRRGDLVVTAARPGMGKTALLLQEATQMARMGIRARIISAEMTAVELTKRLVVQISGVENQRIKHRRLEKHHMEKIDKAVKELESLPIDIDEEVNFDRIRANCMSAYNIQEFGWLGIDYLQRLSGGDGQNETQRIGNIAKGFKNIAKGLNIPVHLLSQLNRGVENRGVKVPLLSDLRDSGEVEQEADMVRFIYRAEYYGQDFCLDGSTPSPGSADIINAKNRDGLTGSVVVGWEGKCFKFSDKVEDIPTPSFNQSQGDAPF